MKASPARVTLRSRAHGFIQSQFVMFLIVGGAAAVVNFVSRIVVSRWLAYAPAVTVAFGFGMLTAFVLNRLFVFKGSTQAVHHQAAWFVLINLAGLAQTLIISVFLAHHAFPWAGFHWHAESVAHMIGIAFPIVSSYFGHKYLSFRH